MVLPSWIKIKKMTSNNEEKADALKRIRLFTQAVTYRGAENEGFIAPTLNDIYGDRICQKTFPIDELGNRSTPPSQFLIAVCFNRGVDTLNKGAKLVPTSAKKETRRRRINTKTQGRNAKALMKQSSEFRGQPQQNCTNPRAVGEAGRGDRQIQSTWKQSCSEYQANHVLRPCMPGLEGCRPGLENKAMEYHSRAKEPPFAHKTGGCDVANVNGVNGGMKLQDCVSQRLGLQVEASHLDACKSTEVDCSATNKLVGPGTTLIIVKSSQGHQTTTAENIRVVHCNKEDVAIKSLKIVECIRNNQATESNVRPIKCASLASSFPGHAVIVAGDVEGKRKMAEGSTSSGLHNGNIEGVDVYDGENKDKCFVDDLHKESDDSLCSGSLRRCSQCDGSSVKDGTGGSNAATTAGCFKNNIELLIAPSGDDVMATTVSKKQEGSLTQRSSEHENTTFSSGNQNKELTEMAETKIRTPQNGTEDIDTSVKDLFQCKNHRSGTFVMKLSKGMENIRGCKQGTKSDDSAASSPPQAAVAARNCAVCPTPDGAPTQSTSDFVRNDDKSIQDGASLQVHDVDKAYVALQKSAVIERQEVNSFQEIGAEKKDMTTGVQASPGFSIRTGDETVVTDMTFKGMENANVKTATPCKIENKDPNLCCRGLEEMVVGRGATEPIKVMQSQQKKEITANFQSGTVEEDTVAGPKTLEGRNKVPPKLDEENVALEMEVGKMPQQNASHNKEGISEIQDGLERKNQEEAHERFTSKRGLGQVSVEVVEYVQETRAKGRKYVTTGRRNGNVFPNGPKRSRIAKRKQITSRSRTKR